MGYVLGLEEVDRTRIEIVGGKGAQLGELVRLEGVRVPDGVVVTTDAYRRVLAGGGPIEDALDRLSAVRPEDGAAIRELSAQIREQIESLPLPDDLVTEIGSAVDRLGGAAGYAVRSSATAEDLPGASFAGQQDSYLDVVGVAAVLTHISRCWASLFTERAVSYRMRNGFDHRAVSMAVVVQRMLCPDASGVLFTADPVSSNRKVATVEAVLGLGEALVSGRVNADVYTVRDGEVTVEAVARDLQGRAALTVSQVARLARLGRRIEAHFGSPQDIEWCLVDDEFHVVQSRPITTLFPIPATGDLDNHVYVSVGHQQMMTDAMKPLGLSLWHLTTSAVMTEAGGRLFVDVTGRLASPATRGPLLDMMGRGDPLVRDALESVLDRGDFVPSRPGETPGAQPPGAAPPPIDTDPAIVTDLIEHSEAALAVLERDIESLSGPALFDAMSAMFDEDKRILFDPRSLQVIMAGMESTWWLNDHLQEWLGEKNVADTLTQSAPHNVTSEMGLALLDVADVIRPHPEVVAFLRQVEDAGPDRRDFLDELGRLAGGRESAAAIRGYLDRYGMRCAGEIDITRPRWSERPAMLVPTILNNVTNFGPGAGKERFERGLEQARRKESEILARLRALPDGDLKADEVETMIARVRTFVGYREYPKYNRVCRSFVYKRALLREADRLVHNHALREREDIFYLRFDELREAARSNRVDDDLIRRRKAEFGIQEGLTPPRVLTSDGEGIAGTYHRDGVPPGALVGLGVSGGTVEGRARVVTDMARADLEPGDILVTPYTDPSWTPLFVAITGLVTEVGGLMTHGAVIAREYGLPAVVGVQQATRLIQDGQRLRLHGTEGYIEILEDGAMDAVRNAIEQHWRASELGDIDTEHAIYAVDAVLDYPQSGERFRGRATIAAQRGGHPADRHFTVLRITGSADLWVSECLITYDGVPTHSVSIMEFADGEVVHETQYFADGFAAPESRAALAERIPD